MDFIKEKAQTSVSCRNLKLMSRPGFLSFALVQLRPNNFSRDLVPCSCLSSGRDINYSRDLIGLVNSQKLMSPPRSSFLSTTVCITTSVFGRDPVFVITSLVMSQDFFSLLYFMSWPQLFGRDNIPSSTALTLGHDFLFLVVT